MLLHLENMTHCEDVQCFRPWVFQVGLCTILVFLIEAQVLYAGVFVSLPLTAHCSRLMNSTEGTNRGLTMMRELSSMVWIRLVPWCLRYTKDKETPSGPTANSVSSTADRGSQSPQAAMLHVYSNCMTNKKAVRFRTPEKWNDFICYFAFISVTVNTRLVQTSERL